MNLEKIEGAFQESSDGKCSVSEEGMVSTGFAEATQAGVDILKKGGNAIDAACAAALALCVCEPQASGLGGQSMALLHYQGHTVAIDGSSRVPSLAHLDSIDGKEERFNGHRASTVPSTPAVLGYLQFRYGSLDWATVLEPAIRIAHEGYAITDLQSRLQTKHLDTFLGLDNKSGADYFLMDGKVPYQAGERFIQKDLAALLETLSAHGAKSFYSGQIAQQINEDMRENGGFIRSEDLALIPWPVERKPIKRKYRKLDFYTCPPPSAGRTLILVLQMMKNMPSKFLRSQSPESYHFMAETFRKALLNNKERPFDPNIYPQLPDDKRILSRDYARVLTASIRDGIDPTLPLADLYPAVNDTTHLSVMDKKGNAIGITQSIERVYGAKVAARGLGFLYNNYMSALETQDPSHPYYLRPNAVPWSSVAPIIAMHEKKPWLVAGSPGSERIFSTVSQFLSHIVDCNRPISEAMMLPRFHCSIGGNLSIELERFDPAIADYLENVGYKIVPKESFSFYLGAIHAVLKAQTKDEFQGVAEIRRDGIAGGP